MKKSSKALLLFLLMVPMLPSFAQDSISINDNKPEADQDYVEEKSPFQYGLYLGALFANQYTASGYDGYGFDVDGNKNNFSNSWMYQKIFNEYGGAYGMTDQIAEALGVDPYTWAFDEGDMPTNMRYNPAFAVGLTVNYSVDKNNSILLNVNASKLVVTGNFTIFTPQSNSASSNQLNNGSNIFSIVGGEQRLLLELGYQRILGDPSKFNVIVEGGLHATFAKFDKNIININNLTIDLTQYANNAIFATAVPQRRPVGIGFGAFGGLGVNANMGHNTTIQLIYTPSFEQIKIGANIPYQLQNYIGIRLYYDLFGDKEEKTDEPIEDN